MPELSSRYSRQILFGEIGNDGQQRLAKSLVVVLGCGALGTVQAEALCRAGVGRLRIVDRDFVEESNLQRQTLFTEEDARSVMPKAVAAQRRLGQINSDVEVEAFVADVNVKNIEGLVQGAICILDATDNFETRFLINDAAIKHRIPWVYGAAVGSYGVSMTVLPQETPCLRCVLEKLPAPGSSPTCDTAGVLSPIVNVVASVQVAEALKILSGNTQRINRRMLCFDVWENSYRQIEIANVRNQGDCPCCQLRRFEFLDGVGSSVATTLCGRDSVQISVRDGSGVNLRDLAQRLKAAGKVQINEFLLRLTVGQFEIAVFPDGRGIVRGTKDTQVARSLYAKYVGV
ncbi:MAG: thiazole biosynthesis adenylyltransferase ThiF [Acidobacteria bacterium]|nr:thiazole biosynthesis adenylyltransferase ThiF [Acidobacteriota bacterium]